MSELHRAVSALEEFLTEVSARGSLLSRSELERVRLEVWLVVDELKALGEPPERVITFVKSVLRESGFDLPRSALAGFIVPWCIERYYDVDDTRV